MSRSFVLILVLICHQAGKAQIFGGYMQLRQLQWDKIAFEFKITFDQDGVFRDRISVNWGDGSLSFVEMTSVNEHPSQRVREFVYSEIHSFPSPGRYAVSAVVCCWSDKIKNIDHAQLSPFILNNQINLTDLRFSDTLESPVLINSIYIDEGAIDIPLTYEIRFDESLSEIAIDTPNIASYRFPWEFGAGSVHDFSLSDDGTLRWHNPIEVGLYVFGFRVQDQIGRYTRYYGTIQVDQAVYHRIRNWQRLSLANNPGEGLIRLNQSFDQITAIDAQGRIIEVVNQNTWIDLSQVPSGFYFILLHEDEFVFFTRYIKL